jgi:hypothetical protein
LETETCPECISGEVGCEETDIQCWIRGLCQGSFITEVLLFLLSYFFSFSFSLPHLSLSPLPDPLLSSSLCLSLPSILSVIEQLFFIHRKNLDHLKIAKTCAIQHQDASGSVMTTQPQPVSCLKTAQPWMKAAHLVSAAVQTALEKQVS